MTVHAYSNKKLRAWLLAHLSECKLCGHPPTRCLAGRALFNLVGRTDSTPSPRYDNLGFRVDRLIDIDQQIIDSRNRDTRTEQRNAKWQKSVWMRPTSTFAPRSSIDVPLISAEARKLFPERHFPKKSLARRVPLVRLLELKTMPYQEYLQTPEWQKMRWKMFRWSRRKCETCGAKKDLQVHHKTYERRGEEEAGDLIVLCRECHEKTHLLAEIAAESAG